MTANALVRTLMWASRLQAEQGARTFSESGIVSYQCAVADLFLQAYILRKQAPSSLDSHSPGQGCGLSTCVCSRFQVGGKGQAGKGRAPVQEAQLALLQSLVQAGTDRAHAPEALRRLPAAQLLPSLRMCQVISLACLPFPYCDVSQHFHPLSMASAGVHH